MNDTVRNFFELWSCDTNFENFKEILTKKYDYEPKGIFFNKNNDSIVVVLLSDYLEFYNLNTKEQTGYKDMGNFYYKINESELLLFSAYQGMYDNFLLENLTKDFDLNKLYYFATNNIDGFIYMEINADLNKNSMFVIQSFIYSNFEQISPSKFKTVYETQYSATYFFLDTATSEFKIQSNNRKIQPIRGNW
jgi:hypothetical protein